MTTNADVLAMLSELAGLTTLAEESPQSFKVRAYENAKLGIEGYGSDVSGLSITELTKIKGVGKSTASKIREFIDSGTVDKLEKLRLEYPPEFVELSKIPGLGPKTLKLVRSELGVEDLEGLKAAIAGEKLRTLPRMGATSEAKIAKAIERLGLTGKDRRTPVADALPLADRLVADLGLVDGVTDVMFCGSLRRMAETIGDIDITVASSDPEAVMRAVVDHGAVSEIILSGGTKTSFLTAKGLQVDVRVVEPSQFGAATLYFTGSKAPTSRCGNVRSIGAGCSTSTVSSKHQAPPTTRRARAPTPTRRRSRPRSSPAQPRPRSMRRSTSSTSRHRCGKRPARSRRPPTGRCPMS